MQLGKTKKTGNQIAVGKNRTVTLAQSITTPGWLRSCFRRHEEVNVTTYIAVVC
jgi:hypothetical protein